MIPRHGSLKQQAVIMVWCGAISPLAYSASFTPVVVAELSLQAWADRVKRRRWTTPRRPWWFCQQQESEAMLLDHPWPPDLHPAEAGFKPWTETILRRMGYWDDPTRLDNLTADEFLGIETAGSTTLADLIAKGNAAIARHASQPDRPGHSIVIAQWGSQEQAHLRRLARSAWPHQVWGKDPRFTDLLPNADQTVAEIATDGETDDQKETPTQPGLRPVVFLCPRCRGERFLVALLDMFPCGTRVQMVYVRLRPNRTPRRTGVRFCATRTYTVREA